MKTTKEKNTMNTIFSLTTILSAILAVGFIEDCGGHCMGNENWTMFAVMFTSTIVFAVLSGFHAATLFRRY